MKRTFLLFASIIRFVLAQRYIEKCSDQYVGDGLCDIPCNLKRYRWDGGDCCPETCQSRGYVCGNGAYQCLENNVPDWFFEKIQLCFKQSAVVEAGQCGGFGAPSKLCAPPGEFTRPYLDDTDDRPGGCRMTWALEKLDNFFSFPSYFNDIKLCFRWRQKNSRFKVCRGQQQDSCVGLGEYTPEYIDDSDHWIGDNGANSCVMSWKLQVPATNKKSDSWVERLMFCIKFEATGDHQQCSWNWKTRYCAVANRWTLYYHDNTDNRNGGCKLQWGIFVT